MLVCFPKRFARLANIGSVANAKQSLQNFSCYKFNIVNFFFRIHLQSYKPLDFMSGILISIKG